MLITITTLQGMNIHTTRKCVLKIHNIVEDGVVHIMFIVLLYWDYILMIYVFTISNQIKNVITCTLK